MKMAYAVFYCRQWFDIIFNREQKRSLWALFCKKSDLDSKGSLSIMADSQKNGKHNLFLLDKDAGC
ncbi:hypothetical protein [Candidatus Endomicrobiellum agilis]|jgi:hypothetical protein|uniref:hypothetical protein n=1 Tax=Candidatus Endomicrobiellum agilis TaxID=3238957 RepID=UPI003580B40D|nr:hypothetical protein [Endomicrobium sp.]